MPRSLFLLAFGWIGVLAVCTMMSGWAFSASRTMETPTVQSSGRVLHVGPARRLKTPSEAARVARRGDTIRIDAGSYFDCAVWRTPHITLIGEGPGYAHIQDISCDGKALWVFYDSPAKVENIRFSGATAIYRNGAGIRWEGHGWLIVHRSKFDRNQMAILAHNRRASSVSVSDSVFEENGYCATYCGHGIYAGLISTLIVRNSQFRKTHFGHHIKSRALTSHIIGNHLSDGPTGTASYAINLPNSGTATIRGNIIQKGPLSDNVYCAICIGEEITTPGAPTKITGIRNPSTGILIDGNTFQNDSGRKETVFVWNRGGDPVSLSRNTLGGPGGNYVMGPRPELDRNK